MKKESHASRVNRLAAQRMFAVKRIRKEEKDHVLNDAVDNDYAIVETSQGVVLTETPDAPHDLEEE